jgi:CDP-paratose 2-epimerase
MKTVIVTGSLGLIGSQSVEYFAKQGFRVVGIDNNMRRYFFGEEASTAWNKDRLQKSVPGYIHQEADIRDYESLKKIFAEFSSDISLVIHTAAQPSHDWAAREPLTDFGVNALGTVSLLELTRQYCPKAVFIFTSTSKVYGDSPNKLPFIETETRWDLPQNHASYNGVDELMTIDQSLHSIFGASKVAADVMVQEFGRYFGMKTVCFRGGCLTGPNHSGTMLHGFLAYLMKCCATGESYTVFGYKGKQVRDNIHSYDLLAAFHEFYKNPRSGEVYNIGGGRENSCSMLEAISICEKITGKKMNYVYSDQNRIGDHIWYVSNQKKFQSHYPSWRQKYSVSQTLEDIYQQNRNQWQNPKTAVKN